MIKNNEQYNLILEKGIFQIVIESKQNVHIANKLLENTVKAIYSNMDGQRL